MAEKHNTWALLVGIDYYVPGDKRRVKYRNLNGCVSDIDSIKNYLNTINVDNISTLTSSIGPDGPQEDCKNLPIYPNIVRELENITEKADPGDIVYIHYSGHGIMRSAETFNPDEDNAGDKMTGTALALMDVMAGGAYLTGYQLGVFIKRMVQQKCLRVTLVLDSCFSGQGLRNSNSQIGGYTIRSGEGNFDDGIIESDVEAEKIAGDIGGNPVSEFRSTTKIRSWLSDPEGCTILTACEADEVAGETRIDGKFRGVLTYWILKILSENPSKIRPTYKRVRDYVERNIHYNMPTRPQSPILLGETDCVFLGKQRVIEKPTSYLRQQFGNCVELDIGWAQGAAVGAVYGVYTDNEVAGFDYLRWCEAHITRIENDKPFKSTAMLAPAGQNAKSPKIGIGSRVALEKWAVPLNNWLDITSLRGNISEHHLRAVETEVANIPGFDCRFRSELAGVTVFSFGLDGNGRLELLEGGKVVPRVPKISLEDDGWAVKAAYVVSHIARYRVLQSIQNNDLGTQLRAEWFSFEAHVLDNYYDDEDCADHTLDFNNVNTVSEGDVLRFTFEMDDSCPLDFVYVSFFTFDAAFGTYKVHPGQGQSSVKISQDSPAEFGLRMSIPEKCCSEDPNDVMDVVRVFISTSKICWDEIALPNLSPDIPQFPRDVLILPADTLDPLSTEGGGLGNRNAKVIRSREDDYLAQNPKTNWVIMDLKIYVASQS
ncbi:hypothetical protein TWF694_010196 [Orbilia ellipsospora]|uniref:Peptidase C14 caspase domain-containing protein n=1 Tax=Orbilia ellipsospora TaxID=2528407 RepID=A0AAV9X9L0_9PEZI